MTAPEPSPGAPGSGRPPGLPFADELLSERSKAWVEQSLERHLAAGNQPAPGAALPFADELLSERSKAWVEQSLERHRLGEVPPAPGPSPADDLPNIAEYRIGRRLGRGGMGTVYECFRDGHRLAIKIITAGRYAAEEERRRFRTEIGVLLRLRHQNISRLRDFGQQGQIAWFVMDFIDGLSFAQWREEAKPAPAAVAALLGTAARAIAHAHRQGIVHRDLNPSNLMVLADGTPVIMDFGLARDLDSDEVLTVSGMTVGTPPYMSPEQTLGNKGLVTSRTDVWGLGAILYHGLAGRAPFEGPNNLEIFRAINEDDPARPSLAAGAAVPRDLEAICLRCLQRDPADRYPDMDSLALDLERFATGQRVRVRLPGLIAGLRRRVRRRPLPWILAAALVLLGVGFLSYAAFEQIRRWAVWTGVEDARFADAKAIPEGMSARDGLLRPVAAPALVAGGLGPVGDFGTAGAVGWWWLERPGLQGDVRVALELSTPVDDALEMVINAGPEPPREWWHHPAGWAIKLQSAEVMSLAVQYRDQPGALSVDNGFLIPRPRGGSGRTGIVLEVRGTACTVTVAGSPPVTVEEPLALGGSDRRALALRFFSPRTRLVRMQVQRLAAAQLVSPLAGPDALLRHGHAQEAIADYRLVAEDHRGTELGSQALLRAFAVSCRDPASEPFRDLLYADLKRQAGQPWIDESDRMRATCLWSTGDPQVGLAIARDLVRRRPDLNPIHAFLGDRTWEVPDGCGDDVLRLVASAPDVAGLALTSLGLTDLAPLAGRRAWSINIADNRISDLAPVSGSGCTTLMAARNRITDLRPVAALVGLNRLNLTRNQVSDLRPLAGLASLHAIELGSNQISDLAGLPGGVTDIGLSHNPLAGLVGLPVANLKRLNLAQTQVKDIGFLAGAVRLESLDLSDTAVADLSPLHTLPLGELRINHCPHADLRTLAITGLHRLFAMGSGITDPALLSAALAGGLAGLDLTDNPLTAWPAMPSPGLRELYLVHCPLADASGLAGLAAVRRLDLAGCALADATPLAGLGQLARLDLRDNHLTEVGALLAAPPPTLLLVGNPLSEAGSLAVIAAGRRLHRPDLLWQGASILSQRSGDRGSLRQSAVAHGSRRYAIYHAPKPITVAEAQALAVAAGARLACIPDAELNALLARGGIENQPVWLGVSLAKARVMDDAGALPPFIGQIPPLYYRGYSALPVDGGRLALMEGGIWVLCPEGTAAGAVLEWDDWAPGSGSRPGGEDHHAAGPAPADGP